MYVPVELIVEITSLNVCIYTLETTFCVLSDAAFITS